MLEFYWSLGRDIVALKAEQTWGGGLVEQLSLDLSILHRRSPFRPKQFSSHSKPLVICRNAFYFYGYPDTNGNLSFINR